MLPHHTSTYASVYAVGAIQNSLNAMSHALLEIAIVIECAPQPLRDSLRQQLPVVTEALEEINALTTVSLENVVKQQEYN